MPSRGRLCGCLIVGWLLGAVWVAPVSAQPRALPPNEAVFLQPYPSNGVVPCSATAYADSRTWTWQFLPDGLLYPAYLAGGRESRFASNWIFERDQGWLWDVTLGGRAGMLRFGTLDDDWPEGWQLDIEGAAFPRMALQRDRDLVATDLRFGVPLTFRHRQWEAKLAYDHLSSHLADEFIETFPEVQRVNYVRDSLVLGVAVRPRPELRLYAEAGWAFYFDGGSRPWEFQFGADYSPARPLGIFGAPFLALNGRIRQDIEFGGNFTFQAGRQWRGQSGHLLRFGVLYFNGKSDQYQFSTEHEEQIGVGMWYDY